MCVYKEFVFSKRNKLCHFDSVQENIILYKSCTQSIGDFVEFSCFV